MKKSVIDKNVYDAAGCWSWLFFSYVSPVLEYSKKNQLQIDELGKPRPIYDVKIHQARLETAWNYYKNDKGKNRLFKAVFRAYRWEYFVSIFWNTIICFLQLATPFLLRNLILFIQNPDEKPIVGVLLVMGLMLSKGLSDLLQE